MTTTAAGVIAIAKNLARDTIAATAAFRAWDGNAWTVAQAKNRIYLDALPPPPGGAAVHSLTELRTLRPYCLVYKPPDFGVTLRHSANGPSNSFTPSGVLVARFERDVPAASARDPGEVDRQFENFLGAVMASYDRNSPGLAELAGLPDYLNIRQMDELGPFRAREDEAPSIGDCQWYYLQLEWGARL